MSQTHWNMPQWHLQQNSVYERGVISFTYKKSSNIMLAVRSKRNRSLLGVAMCVFEMITLLIVFKMASIFTNYGFEFLYFYTKGTHVSHLKMGAALSIWGPWCCCWRLEWGDLSQVTCRMLKQDTFISQWTGIRAWPGWVRTERSHAKGLQDLKQRTKNSGAVTKRLKPCSANG